MPHPSRTAHKKGADAAHRAGSWSLPPWLGSAAATAAAALASVQRAAAARLGGGGATGATGAALTAAAGGGSEDALYVDAAGNAHLGSRAAVGGVDEAVRQIKVRRRRPARVRMRGRRPPAPGPRPHACRALHARP